MQKLAVCEAAPSDSLILYAVAALTGKIKAMADHMRVHRKDYHSRRGLEAMLNRRKSLLQYLRRKDFDAYAIVLSRLGLRDNYMKLVGARPSCFELAHSAYLMSGKVILKNFWLALLRHDVQLCIMGHVTCSTFS